MNDLGSTLLLYSIDKQLEKISKKDEKDTSSKEEIKAADIAKIISYLVISTIFIFSMILVWSN